MNINYSYNIIHNNINYINLTFLLASRDRKLKKCNNEISFIILIFLEPQNYQIIRVLIISRKMVSRSNASKVIDIQDEIRTADGLSFNEPLKFTAKSSTIRSDKKRRGTTETQLSKNTNRSQIIDKDISDAVSQTCGIVLWNRDTLLRYGISVSFRISNQIVVDNREYVAMISVYRCRIFRSTIIQFLNLSFRIPRIYFRIEYILVFVNFWYLKFYFFSHICSIYLFQFFYSFILLSIIPFCLVSLN